MNPTTRTLAELAADSGVPARTIRFYIARGLLPGPTQAGRGAAYTSEHLNRLEAIKKLQARGLMLSEVAQALAGETQEATAPRAPSAWWQYEVADDVVVWVRAETSPWRLKQVRAAVAEMQTCLKKADTQGESDGN